MKPNQITLFLLLAFYSNEVFARSLSSGLKAYETEVWALAGIVSISALGLGVITASIPTFQGASDFLYKAGIKGLVVFALAPLAKSFLMGIFG